MKKGAKMLNEALDAIKKYTPPPYLFYLIILVCLIYVVIPIFIFYQFGTSIFFKSYIDLDSSRYLLSAMAQVLAAILALVVGFSFVLIQLSAHFGSHRVFDLFLKGRAFWCILIIFLFSIIYNFAILRILSEETLDLLVNWINFSVILVSISFLLLFPYTYATISQLKPEKIIQGIIKQIIKHKSDDVKSLERDTISPIADILNKAVRANDPHTLTAGLDALEKLNIERISSRSIDGKDKLEVVKYYMGKVSRLIEISLDENDESAVKDISDSLKNIGLKAIESRWIEVPQDDVTIIKNNKKYRQGVSLSLTDPYDNISNEIKEVLRDACKKVIEKKWNVATKSILDSIEELLIKSREELVLGGSDDISWNRHVFSSLSKEEKIFSMKYLMKTISNIVIELFEKDINFDDYFYNLAVGDILEESLEVLDSGNCNRIGEVIDYIVDIGIEAVKKDHNLKEDVKEHFLKVASSEKCPSVPIYDIGNKGFSLASESKKPETIWICSCLRDIGISCASKGLDESTYPIFSFLEGIERNYKHKDTETDETLEVTDHIIKIINEVGNISIEKGLEMSSRDAFSSFIEIGMQNEDVDLRKRICENLKGMFQKDENKEIFNSELEKFKKFKEICDFDNW